MKKNNRHSVLLLAFLAFSAAGPQTITALPNADLKKAGQEYSWLKKTYLSLCTRWQQLIAGGKKTARARIEGVKGSLEAQGALAMTVVLIGLWFNELRKRRDAEEHAGITRPVSENLNKEQAELRAFSHPKVKEELREREETETSLHSANEGLAAANRVLQQEYEQQAAQYRRKLTQISGYVEQLKGIEGDLRTQQQQQSGSRIINQLLNPALIEGYARFCEEQADRLRLNIKGLESNLVQQQDSGTQGGFIGSVRNMVGKLGAALRPKRGRPSIILPVQVIPGGDRGNRHAQVVPAGPSTPPDATWESLNSSSSMDFSNDQGSSIYDFTHLPSSSSAPGPGFTRESSEESIKGLKK